MHVDVVVVWEYFEIGYYFGCSTYLSLFVWFWVGFTTIVKRVDRVVKYLDAKEDLEKLLRNI